MQATSIDARDYRGRTGLSCAVCAGAVKEVRVLISRHANPEIADDDGMTPLMEAAYRCNLDIVALLAPLVSDINNTDKKGNTGLHHLGAYSGLGNPDEERLNGFRCCLECLLLHGAALGIRDQEGDTLFEKSKSLAKRFGQSGGYEPYLTAIGEVKGKVDALTATTKRG